MKTHLAFSALVVAGSYAAVELARSVGVSLPVWLNLGNAFLAFTVVTTALVVTADYGPKSRPIALPAPVRRMKSLRPHSIAAAHHHLYAIRRGAEAARLSAPPMCVTVYPRNNVAHWKRAA